MGDEEEKDRIYNLLEEVSIQRDSIKFKLDVESACGVKDK